MTSTLSSKGPVTVPKVARDRLGPRAGTVAIARCRLWEPPSTVLPHLFLILAGALLAATIVALYGPSGRSSPD